MKKEHMLMLTVCLSSLLMVYRLPSDSAASSGVYVSPGNNVFYTDTTAVNFEFNVTVWVTNVSDVAGWQVQLNYNSAILNCTGSWQPQWDTQYVFFARTTNPTASYQVGCVLVGEVFVPWNQSKFTGAGKLCILEFQIIATPQKGAELPCTLDITQIDYGTYLLDSSNIQIPIMKTNGYYRYLDRHQPFSSFTRLFANNSVVRMVYPSDSTSKPLGCAAAMVSDWTASAFIYGLLDNVTEGLDTESAFVNQTTGKPEGSSGDRSG
jgi:hypothetical protein